MTQNFLSQTHCSTDAYMRAAEHSVPHPTALNVQAIVWKHEIIKVEMWEWR